MAMARECVAGRRRRETRAAGKHSCAGAKHDEKQNEMVDRGKFLELLFNLKILRILQKMKRFKKKIFFNFF